MMRHLLINHPMSQLGALTAFARRFLDPEDLGLAVGAYTRDQARVALGRQPVESAVSRHHFDSKDLPMSTSDQKLEAEIIAAGANIAPRITPADLDANIACIEIVKHVAPSGQVLRWAVITVHNGFAVAGQPSASASSENDNQAIGERIAIDNAKRELWPLMGYELKSQLHGRQMATATSKVCTCGDSSCLSGSQVFDPTT